MRQLWSRVLEKAVGMRGKGGVFLFSKLCDIIILRFPDAKSNGADTTFSGWSSGLHRIRVFSFLIYLLKSFLKALNRYDVFFYIYIYSYYYRRRSALPQIFKLRPHTHTYVTFAYIYIYIDFSPRNDIHAKERRYYY